MNSFRRNIPILASSQALMMSGMSLILTTASLVGLEIAPSRELATLPIAIIFIAVMCTSIPAGLLMERIGRKNGFLFSTFFGIVGSAISMAAIIYSEFWLFVVGMFLIGIFNGFGNYYRFTAADVVEKKFKSRAISYVMAGGVLAAIIGPNLANLTRNGIEHAIYAASYASLMGVYICIFIVLLFLKIPEHETSNKNNPNNSGTERSLMTIVSQKKFIVALLVGMFGYGVMSLIMTATPLAMHHNHHDFSATAFTIQWHYLGMFVPSFFTGSLISRFGVTRIMAIGAITAFCCIVVNLSGTSEVHFWLALVLLGIGWNFMFIGATTLLTETYSLIEKGKTQAFNDFLIYTVMSLSALSAGVLQSQFGWQTINYSAIPLLTVVLIGLLWLKIKQQPISNTNC